MKTRPKKTKKYSDIKDCKEQPREIRDQCDDMQDEEGLHIFRPLLYGGSELFHRKVIESPMKLFKVGDLVEVTNGVTSTNSGEFHYKRDKNTKNDGHEPKGVMYDRKPIQNCHNTLRKT